MDASDRLSNRAMSGDRERKKLSSPQVTTSEGGKMLLHIPRESRETSRKTDVTPYKYRQPSRTLEEDQYYTSLQEIITRDYFPAVKEIQDKIDQIDGDKKDFAKDLVMQDASNLSLSEFQRKYTSEDNSSFGKLIEKEMTKKRKIRKSMKAIESSKTQTTKKLDSRKQQWLLTDRPLTEDQQTPQKPGVEDNRPSTLDSWASNDRNQLMFPPESHHGSSSHIGTVDPANTRIISAPANDEEANRQRVINALNNKSSGSNFNGYHLVTKSSFTLPNASKEEKLVDSLLEEQKRKKQEEKEKSTHPGAVSKVPSSRLTKTLTPAASRLVKNSAGLSGSRGFSFNVTGRKTPK